MGQGPPATPQGLLPEVHASGWEVSALPLAEGGLVTLGHLHPPSLPTAGRGLHCQLFHWAQPVRGMVSLQQRVSL